MSCHMSFTYDTWKSILILYLNFVSFDTTFLEMSKYSNLNDYKFNFTLL